MAREFDAAATRCNCDGTMDNSQGKAHLLLTDKRLTIRYATFTQVSSSFAPRGEAKSVMPTMRLSFALLLFHRTT